jgi:hypothetical protein
MTSCVLIMHSVLLDYSRRENVVAAENGPLSGASFAQKTFSQISSADGAIAGRTVSDVAGSLQAGELRAADVPVQFVVRDGSTLNLKTRSAQALEQTGIPRSQSKAIDMTGDAAAEARLTGQLRRNGLTLRERRLFARAEVIEREYQEGDLSDARAIHGIFD